MALQAAFHLARRARERYALAGIPASIRGDLPATDMLAMRRLAATVTAARPPGRPPVLAGQLTALAVLHELGHLVIEQQAVRAAAQGARPPIELGLERLRSGLGRPADQLLERFAREFPGETVAGRPELSDALLAELMLTRVANENPAAEPLRELFDDRPLAAGSSYVAALAILDDALGGKDDDAALDPLGAGLLAILRAPAAHAPTSLAGQLRFVRERWVPLLGAAAAALVALVDRTLGELAEEEAGFRFGLGGAAPPEVPRLGGPGFDVERFSPDADWMPGLVLQARSTYVWLEQLSRRHGRPITTLDAIPDEELDRLARWGISGLWLIGVWDRSPASQAIKRRRGNPDALGSAYAIDDYRIAEELGGEAALANLRERALARGIRLACDMVPNHMAIDSRWLIDHPEWFLSLPEPPYPAYSFGGPDLSSDGRVEIVIEDHYWDGSDAAVVFRRRDRWSGETSFVYHGNDGTSLPWNDTAQLDFLREEVREQVIRTIVDVARRFPVIRFDAAMVLARQHVQRLWWPEPGAGGGVPSRAAHAISRAEFDRRMPAELWRDVVDRVATEAPGTLLLAEAFWLLEGYFVRSLGMHRVYNSAFMHMLRDEDVAGYRRLVRETLEFDPEILERYVNFMTNPDEASAVEQFGREDKAFGVATVMATIPGLPMLGHGQVEGLAEKYGMEFRRAQWAEEPDIGVIDRHEREIAPLLRERARFARAGDFRLYDFVREDGSVDEQVLAYSNGRGDARSLVVFHDRFGSTAGWLRDSTPVAVKAAGGKHLQRTAIADALELPGDDATWLAFRDRRTGLEHLRSVGALRSRGLHLALDAYSCRVFEGFRVLAADRPWSDLAGRLGETGVPSLEVALEDLALAPLHDRLRGLFRDGHVRRLADCLAPAADVSRRDLEPALTAVAAWDEQLRDEAARRGVADRRSRSDPRTPRDRLAGAGEAARRVEAVAALLSDEVTRVAVALALMLGAGSPDEGVGRAARQRFEACRLQAPLEDGLRTMALDNTLASRAVLQVRALLAIPRPREPTDGARAASASDRRADVARATAASWLRDPDVRAAVGSNTWDEREWLVREAWDALVVAASALHALNASGPDEIRIAAALAAALSAAAEDAGYRADELMRP